MNFEGKHIWISFRYEKLSRICFCCGCIMHSKQRCLGGEVGGSQERGASKQFGAWMSASLARRSGVNRQSKSIGMGGNYTNVDHEKSGEEVTGGGWDWYKGSIEGGTAMRELIGMS